jgi:hypothetical protein
MKTAFKNYMKKFRVTIIFLIFFFFFLFVSSLLSAFAFDGGLVYEADCGVSCPSGLSMTSVLNFQEFTATSSFLSAISVPFRLNTSTSTVTLTICHGSVDGSASQSENLNCEGSGQVLKIQQDYPDIFQSDYAWYQFEFPSFYVEEGDTYYFNFSVPDNQFLVKYKSSSFYSYGQFVFYDGSIPGYDYSFALYENPAGYYTEDDSYMSWFFPQDDYVISNSEWNDWGVYVDLASPDIYDYELLKIYYQTSDGNIYLDYDYISTTSELTYWTVERSVDLPAGPVLAWGEILGTDLENCSDVDDVSCIWYSSAILDSILFTASSTGATIYDYGLTGYSISTSTLLEMYGTTSLEEYDQVNSALGRAKQQLMEMFPFNIPYQIYDQWQLSEDVDLPDTFDPIVNLIGDGNITLDLDQEFFGNSATSVPIWGEQAFVGYFGSENQVYFDFSRSTTTWILWLCFVIGLGWRGKELYQEYSK